LAAQPVWTARRPSMATNILSTLDQLAVAAASIDASQRIVAVNKTFARLLGGSADALVGEDLVTLLTASSSATDSGLGGATAYRLASESAQAWYRLDLVSAGKLKIARLTDVSPEYKALTDIRQFYAIRDRLLFDGKIGTWRYDPDGELYFFSSELSLGHEGASQPVPVPVLQLIQHPDDQARDTEIRERITREGGSASAEIRYREASGSWTHLNVHYRAGRRTASGRYEMLGISQNVTPIAAARDDANRSSQRLTFALNAAQAGAFEYKYADQSLWMSPEFEALFGIEELKRAGGEPLNLLVPGDADAAREFLVSARAGHASAIDVRIARAKGHQWIRLYYDIKERNEKGEPVTGIGLVLDIDERKRQEIALGDARRAAEFANRSKTEFLANMSHELRTPLNAILGFSEMIVHSMFGPLGPKYVEYAHDIHNSGQHLLALVNDVLDLSKLEAGKLELHESDLDIGALIEQCAALLRNRTEAGGVALAVNPVLSLPRLRADERSVRQVLLNLFSNAVKFTPPGGRVTAEAWLDADGTIGFSIGDTGIGMSKEEIAVALSPFGQIDSRLARRHEGTGLGLPICTSLMELHGGTLSVESEPNRGTTLTARFPASRTVRRVANG
jgi:signal transduction histidine kinase